MKRMACIAAMISLPAQMMAQEIVLKNDRIARKFAFDGKAWRTTAFTDLQQRKSLQVVSDEIHILPMGTNGGYTIADFRIQGKPVVSRRGDTSLVQMRYTPVAVNAALPAELELKYYVVKGEPFCRKTATLRYKTAAVVDRLEVERFSTTAPAAGGGRGEPVFADGKWYFGLEYPAFYSRHTDGNTPASYARHYDSVGNYSYISLEGRDVEPAARKGMVRLMHFPGDTRPAGANGYAIAGKTAVAGCAAENQSVEQAFMQYLTSIWKAPRSFLHYNNWFEPKAKDLSGDALVDIWKAFRTAISPYGVKMDAMVADDGWQNRRSIWEPSPRYFPNGVEDVARLSKKLQGEGTGFGLWLSLNGYNSDVNWGKEQGYAEAERNSYFSKYGRYYSLSSDKYKQRVLHQVPRLAKEANLVYYKHDFNEFSDLSAGNNHPPTDRHGHEAGVDAGIKVLLATREAQPLIHQNMTNWVWFSPWWLMYSDYLWMLAGDDGTNKNYPEISTRAAASTDRDTYIWRMWGEPSDRPLVPISRLMTHGVIKTSTGRMETREDDLQDWQEYVLMHYGRGTLLKEWYISPEVMSPGHWKALCTVDRWAARHRDALNNTVFVGGRPDEGHAYGYIGWKGDKGVLVARNTQARTQKLVIPFDRSVNFDGRYNEPYRARVAFPYQDAYPVTFTSGKTIEIELPGYATMAFEFEKGKALPGIPVAPPPAFEKNGRQVQMVVPADVKGRCDLLVIGYPVMPEINIEGQEVKPRRTSKAALNKFAGYARAGMPSRHARDWNMVAIDLLPYAGKKISIRFSTMEGAEGFLLAERAIAAPAAKEGNDVLWPLTHGTRRQTLQLF